MEPFISNDSFDAFRTEEGIEIREKKTAAKKFSLVIMVVGIVFFCISLIPMDGFTYKWITTMFTSVFFYGGILMFVLGILTLVLKGMGSKEGPVTVLNKNTQIMTSRGKEFLFSEMGPLTVQTTDVMNKKMTALLYTYKGKKKAFISGTVINEDVASIERFAEEVNALVTGKSSEAES
ncbi:MAG: hypothetical protein Crog4KO_33950 [Crocinitomicaceae bacterium]